MIMPSQRSSAGTAGPWWPWLALAWLLVAAFQMWSGAGGLDLRLGDSDDAMRLVAVRTFLAGQGWYDMAIARLQPPDGYVSHWSRLIDAGLAGLYYAARPFTGPAGAEWFMRLAWPLVWLAPAMAGVALIAARLAGRRAALIAIAFAAVALPAQIQFQPGRIDHHNVQIALALLGLAAAVWQDRRFAPPAAAVLAAMMLAFGLESLPFVALVAGAFALPGLAEMAAWRRAGRFGGWLALTTPAALAIALPPDQWLTPMCDQIAVNSAAAVALGGAGLWLAARLEAAGRSSARRSLALCLAAGLAAGVFTLVEPACLAGPFGLIDPAIRPIWLDRVGEARSLAASLTTNPAAALSALVFPLMALGLGGFLLGRDRGGARLALVIMLAAVALGVALLGAMIRTYSYAAWFALPLAAAGVVALWDGLGLERLWHRAIPVVLCSPLVLTTLAVLAIQTVKPADPHSPRSARSDACLATASFKPLAALDKGRVAAATNLGAHLLALTPHEVLAAPYHRLSQGIIAANAIFASPPDVALKLARDNAVRWIVVCAKYPPGGIGDAALAHSLWQALKDGRPPAWLRREAATTAGPLVAYRVENWSSPSAARIR